MKYLHVYLLLSGIINVFHCSLSQLLNPVLEKTLIANLATNFNWGPLGLPRDKDLFFTTIDADGKGYVDVNQVSNAFISHEEHEQRYVQYYFDRIFQAQYQLFTQTLQWLGIYINQANFVNQQTYQKDLEFDDVLLQKQKSLADTHLQSMIKNANTLRRKSRKITTESFFAKINGLRGANAIASFEDFRRAFLEQRDAEEIFERTRAKYYSSYQTVTDAYNKAINTARDTYLAKLNALNEQLTASSGISQLSYTANLEKSPKLPLPLVKAIALFKFRQSQMSNWYASKKLTSQYSCSNRSQDIVTRYDSYIKYIQANFSQYTNNQSGINHIQYAKLLQNLPNLETSPKPFIPAKPPTFPDIDDAGLGYITLPQILASILPYEVYANRAVNAQWDKIDNHVHLAFVVASTDGNSLTKLEYNQMVRYLNISMHLPLFADLTAANATYNSSDNEVTLPYLLGTKLTFNVISFDALAKSNRTISFDQITHQLGEFRKNMIKKEKQSFAFIAACATKAFSPCSSQGRLYENNFAKFTELMKNNINDQEYFNQWRQSLTGK